MAEKLYFGIDLGTTNSAISYGHLGSNGKFITQICKISRYGKEGGIESKEVLPSVVYYKYDPKTKEYKYFVGDFAKNQYGKKYGNVMKSVKNYIGYYDALPLDEKILDKKPEDVSSRILKHLVSGIKDKLSLSEEPKDIIITIPASFDQDKCNATLEAADLAGIKSKDSKGNYLNNVLLYEPKAVIYNIANMISNEEIPRETLDFSTPKNVLVYDLGGGTLDVALYKVYNNKEFNFPVIDEIAVGRYTRIGGDDFDNILAKKLVKEFLEYNDCSSDEVDTNELEQIMESKAEYLKLELSDKIFNSRFSGNKVSDDEEFEISEMDLYKGMEFEAYLTKKEIEDTLSPIMGKHLTKQSIGNIDKLVSDKDTNNIIYPIIDVLAKAKEIEPNIDVDCIILNGGMTKFYMIKDRIQEFFGIAPISINDPDLAVAKGAAFYQYCLEKFSVLKESLKKEKIVTISEKAIDITNDYSNILEKEKIVIDNTSKASLLTLGTSRVSDNINLGLLKGHVSLLIKAGTALPVEKFQLPHTYSLPVATDEIEFPIYIGRGNKTDFPNRKIASRKIKLNKLYPAGTVLTLFASVDENKVLNLSGYVGKDVRNKITVSIEIATSSKEEKKGNKVSSTEVKEINPRVELESLKTSCILLDKFRKKAGFTKKKTSPLEAQAKNNAKFKLAQTISDIKEASNRGSFEKVTIDTIKKLENYDMLKGILFDIGAFIYNDMSDAGKEEFKKDCRNILNPIAMGNNNNLNTIVKAIMALGIVKDQESVKILEDLLEDNLNRSYVSHIVRSLGKISADNPVLMRKFMEISETSLDIDAYIYAIGKSYSRKVSMRNDKMVEKMVQKLLKIVKLEKANKDVALIAIGEICNSLEETDYKMDEKFVDTIGKELSELTRQVINETYREKISLIVNVIFGLNLNDEEKTEWKHLSNK